MAAVSRRRLTSLRFCCAANVVTASEAREPDAYRDSSNRLLGRMRRSVVQAQGATSTGNALVTPG